MKKHLVIAAGLAVLSTGAHASMARETALGSTTAIWNADTQSAFQNAASINGTNNYVITEFGGTSTNMEGGFMRNAGSFTYGLYFNNEFTNGSGDHTVDGVTAGNGITGAPSAVNGLDVFFAGDMGVQWGARLHLANVSDKDGDTAFSDDKTYSGMGLGLGMVMGDIEAYANLILTDEYEVPTAATSSKKVTGGGMNIGASYGMNNWRFFFDMNNMDKEYSTTVAAVATTTDADTYESKTMSLGAGHTHEVSSSARILTSIAYKSVTKTAMDNTATAVTGENKVTSIPVTIAFEADANSWLTLRGSVAQSLNGKITNTNSSETAGEIDESNGASSTSFAAGATLNFGKLKVDGIISTGSLAGGAANAGTGGSDTLSLDGVMTNVAVHYWF